MEIKSQIVTYKAAFININISIYWSADTSFNRHIRKFMRIFDLRNQYLFHHSEIS